MEVPEETSAHFHPLTWLINLTGYEYSALKRDAFVQGVFLHEYMHFVQTLASTIGRLNLTEIFRIGIIAGLEYHYGTDLKNELTEADRIDLRAVLESSKCDDFIRSKPRRQYRELIKNNNFFLSDHLRRYERDYDPGNPIVNIPMELSGETLEYPFVIQEHFGTKYAIALTDVVVFENMARQIQRLFLRRNGTQCDLTRLDARRTTIGELRYVCIYDIINDILPNAEDCPKWTIGICQNALLFHNPGRAIKYSLEKLRNLTSWDLDTFVRSIRDSVFGRDNFDQPELGPLIRDFLNREGILILPAERNEIARFLKRIYRICLDVEDNPLYFYNNKITWDCVACWCSQFGCPPIVIDDNTYWEVVGITCTQPCFGYLQLVHSRLS